MAFQQAENDFEAARFEVEIAGFELKVAKAALTHGTEENSSKDLSFPVTSPISGRVLRVFQESATIVNASDRSLVVGEPTDLEVEVDVLSRDAVRIRQDSRVSWNNGAAVNRSLPECG